MLPLKNLLRRKVRTLFAVLQISVAIAAFVSIVGVTQGLRAQFYSISRIFAYDILVSAAGAASPPFSTVTADEAELVRAVEGVEDVSLMGIFVTWSHGPDGAVKPVTVLALEPEGELLDRYSIVRGRALAPGDGAKIVIGELMAREMGLAVGETLRLGNDECEVVGVYEPPIADVPFISGQALMSLGHYQEHLRQPPNILAAHTAPGRRAETPDDVRAALERGQEIAPRIEEKVGRLQAKTIHDYLDSMKQAELVDSFALGISFLAALVSAIGVANTMLMSVFDRTREIGLLRAVGWSRRLIVAMIEVEGLILALAGGVCGIPLGLLLILGAQQLIGMGWLEVSLDPVLYAQAVGFACLIGVFGSLYPAVRAAYLQPTEALRYE